MDHRLPMSAPELAGLNLNALVALDALLVECNVTRAARRIRVTQPAMSQTLARLRELFDDPLLVRRGRGMVRTPRAEAMLIPLSDALDAVHRAVQLGLGFDPVKSERVFRVAMTDLHVMTVLPGLLRTVAEKAPGVRIQVEPTVMGNFAERIGAGEIDLAVGFLLRSAESVASESLLVDEYVCIVRKGHPLARKKRVTLEEFTQHRHVTNTPVGFVPESLAGTGRYFGSPSRIRATSPYLLGVPAVVRATDLVATVPRALIASGADVRGLTVLDAPAELPRVPHSMWWHRRFDRDPAHQWLRDAVRGVFR